MENEKRRAIIEVNVELEMGLLYGLSVLLAGWVTVITGALGESDNHPAAREQSGGGGLRFEIDFSFISFSY